VASGVQMALRIRQGLLRLWVVLSVLWIGGVSVVTWRSLPTEYELTKGAFLSNLLASQHLTRANSPALRGEKTLSPALKSR
jgi:hypothetical protein